MKSSKFFIFSFYLFLIITSTISIVAAQKIQREGFSSIAFNDDYFLIGTFDGELIKYDENKFYSLCKLKDNESVTKIEYYGNKYFLIGGERYLFLYKDKFYF